MRLHKQQLIADYQPLFNAMTDDVCRLVLADNIAQSLCLSLEQRRCQEDSSVFLQLAERLNAAGFLDRDVESFPSDKQVLTRPGQALTRPELAVLMAAAKMYLTQLIENQSALLHDDCCQRYLEAYFPEQLTLQFRDQLAKHPLASQIKATVVSNKIINQAGCRFLAFALESDNGDSTLLDQVACYLAFDRIVDADGMRQEISTQDHPLDAEKQYSLLLQLESALLEMCRWSLANDRAIRPDQETLSRYRAYLNDFRLNTPSDDPATDELGEKMRVVRQLDAFPLVVFLCERNAQALPLTAARYREATRYLGLDAVYARLATVGTRDIWEKKLLADLPDTLKQLIGQWLGELSASSAECCADFFEQPEQRGKIARYRQLYQEAMNAPAGHLPAYLVLVKELQKLLEAR